MSPPVTWYLTAPFSLNWPVIIAGSQMFGTDRTRVLAVFETFRSVSLCLRCPEIC